MADRFNHPDGTKAQDITLRGKRLEMARKASKQNEARRLQRKEMGTENLPSGKYVPYFEERQKKMEEAGGKPMGTNPIPKGGSSYVDEEANKKYDEVLKNA